MLSNSAFGSYSIVKSDTDRAFAALDKIIESKREQSAAANATNQALSQNSTEQATSVEETSASVEQISTTVAQNAENADATGGSCCTADGHSRAPDRGWSQRKCANWEQPREADPAQPLLQHRQMKSFNDISIVTFCFSDK